VAKLLRKDVLKWIRNLSSGSYKKGKGVLVNAKGDRFCCLGVWADQHGCTWQEEPADDWTDYKSELIPLRKGRVQPQRGQSAGTLESNLAYGLDARVQDTLTELNDKNKSWKEVIAYIKSDILPKAKK
jgi:hypothetical protein